MSAVHTRIARDAPVARPINPHAVKGGLTTLSSINGAKGQISATTALLVELDWAYQVINLLLLHTANLSTEDRRLMRTDFDECGLGAPRAIQEAHVNMGVRIAELADKETYCTQKESSNG
jgi:hypothetical protein